MPTRKQKRREQKAKRHDYEIVYPRKDSGGEAHISSLAAEPLRVGDFYTFGRGRYFCDLVVEEVRRESGGGWKARCTVSQRHWI